MVRYAVCARGARPVRTGGWRLTRAHGTTVVKFTGVGASAQIALGVAKYGL